MDDNSKNSKKWLNTGLPLVNQNVYWPAFGNLVCVLGYHLSMTSYLYRHYKELLVKTSFKTLALNISNAN